MAGLVCIAIWGKTPLAALAVVGSLISIATTFGVSSQSRVNVR